jgi:hypothetical protein
MMDSVDEMTEKALDRLKTRSNEPIMSIRNWVLLSVSTPWFEKGFKIAGTIDTAEGELRIESAIVATLDFSSGEGVDLSGQRYQLLQPNAEYIEQLSVGSPDVAAKFMNLGAKEMLDSKSRLDSDA